MLSITICGDSVLGIFLINGNIISMECNIRTCKFIGYPAAGNLSCMCGEVAIHVR
jgi:hypothetical protein